MDQPARLRFLLRIALPIAALIIIFLGGLFPLENLLTLAPASRLTASVVPADVASLTNDARIQNGLPPLAVNPLLTEAAQMKADDMARGSYYAHVSPDGKSPLYWINLAGYKYLNAGENLVIDRDTSADAVNAWLSSPEHRENILRPQFTEIGIGVSRGTFENIPTVFVVEEFGTPYPFSVPPRMTQHAPTPSPALAPIAKTLLPTLPEAVEPGLATSSLASTSQGQGSSTLVFTLAPAFFQPVTPTPLHEEAHGSPERAPENDVQGRIMAYLRGFLHTFILGTGS